MAQIYKNGLVLMKDTCSLTNALMENRKSDIKVGDTFAELMWSDRTLWIVTDVKNQRHFTANRVQTYMKDWTDGTEYPEKNEDGSYKVCDTQDSEEFSFKRKYWYKGNEKVHLSWGEKFGYRDPSF